MRLEFFKLRILVKITALSSFEVLGFFIHSVSKAIVNINLAVKRRKLISEEKIGSEKTGILDFNVKRGNRLLRIWSGRKTFLISLFQSLGHVLNWQRNFAWGP